MKPTLIVSFVLVAGVVANLFGGDNPPGPSASANWNGKAAAGYLDARMTWWTTWPTSARDHETFCVSCHTVLPYAMARPSLRTTLGEHAASEPERKLIENVTKRVKLWSETKPFYPDEERGSPKTAESRGTESILNAVVLTSYDASSSKLSPEAKLALDNMWGQQVKTGDDKGAFSWLQFHNAPWEGDSQYYGSAMAALAVGTAPGNYRSSAEIQENLALLRQYLVRERAKQTLLDQVVLLWASTKVPDLLTVAQQKTLLDEALSKQQADGGFSLSSFVGNWKRRDNTPLDAKSDGYATGLVTYVAQQVGLSRSQAQVAKGLAWLNANQDQGEGRWFAYSLNKQRDLSTDVGKFMSDAATAYAVLALHQEK